jgi:hypothetical protein
MWQGHLSHTKKIMHYLCFEFYFFFSLFLCSIWPEVTSHDLNCSGSNVKR